MIHVIASIEVVPGKREEFIAAFKKVVPAVKAEEGCLDYGPTVDVPTDIPAQGGARDNVVTIVERWENLEALQQHLVAPHMTEYRKTVKDLVVGTNLAILEPA
mgnify:CR=1 FL=1